MLSQRQILECRKLYDGNDAEIVAMFKALNEVNRYRILRILTKQPALTVSDLAQILKISVPLASQHIKVLNQSNLLQKEREGKRVFTKLDQSNPFVKAIVRAIEEAQE